MIISAIINPLKSSMNYRGFRNYEWSLGLVYLFRSTMGHYTRIQPSTI